MVTITDKEQDDQLVSRFLAGDDEAFRELFDRYYTRLVAYASKYVEDYDASTDIVQNVFVNLYENRSQSIIASAKSFLYASVHNACLNVLKHAKVKRAYEERMLSESDEPTSEASDALVMEAEAEAKIAAAMEQLPPQCRKVFMMSRADGLSNQEIADTLGISKRTVETQVSNALRILRRMVLALATLIVAHTM